MLEILNFEFVTKERFKLKNNLIIKRNLLIFLMILGLAFSSSINIASANTTKYTMQDLSEMDYSTLATTVAELHSWSNITDLFQYNEGARRFYSDVNRLKALINELERRGSIYTSTDDKGVLNLIEVIRAGFYLASKYNGLSSINNRQTHDLCIPALLSIQKNPNFRLGTQTQNRIISSSAKIIGNGSGNAETINRFVPILKQYNDNFNTYINQNHNDNKFKSNAVYQIIYDINLDTGEMTDQYTNISKCPWNKRIDAFIDEVGKFMLHPVTREKDTQGYLIPTSIYSYGSLSKLHSDAKKPHRILTDSFNLQPEFSENQFEAARQIIINYDGKDADGNIINDTQMKLDGRKKYLPNKYIFDDGKIIFKTGKDITEEQVTRLYWASKEVQAQFFRMLGYDTALEACNTDDILTIVLYNNKREYEINKFLYGYDTNNGGIYIESAGSFFTYDRLVPEESIYSLEELFRHEFTHYLQGRYQVPGLWGRSDIYKDGRMNWFEEGGAEFFAGSTRTDGVKPRKSMVSNFKNTPDSNRYSVDKIMHSTYAKEGFEFYPYAFALTHYLYNNERHKLNDINEAVKANDPSTYDQIRSRMSRDTELERNHRNNMQSLVNQYDELTTPSISDDYLMNHTKKMSQEIFDRITSICNLRNVQTNINKSVLLNTFTLRGKYIGTNSTGSENDWKEMDKLANEFLKTLSREQWSGYKTLNCYFTNYEVRNGKFQFDLVFHGIVTDIEIDPDIGDPKEFIDKEIENNNNFLDANGPVIANRLISGTISKSDNRDMYYIDVISPSTINIEVTNKGDAGMTWTLYSEEDLNKNLCYGNIEGDKITNSYNVEKPGKYYLLIYWFEGKGLESPYSLKVTGDGVPGDNEPTTEMEIEPNNTFEKANPIAFNKIISGSIAKSDARDMFSIDVQSPKTINIDVTNKGDAEMTWVLYNEDDLNNYVSYGKIQGNRITNSYQADKIGKYYLLVYWYEGKGLESPYELKVTSNSSGDNTQGDNSSENTLILKEIADMQSVSQYSNQPTMPKKLNQSDIVLTYANNKVTIELKKSTELSHGYIHYSIDGSTLLNYRMDETNDTIKQEIEIDSIDSVVHVWFTCQNEDLQQYDTIWYEISKGNN